MWIYTGSVRSVRRRLGLLDLIFSLLEDFMLFLIGIVVSAGLFKKDDRTGP